MARGVMVLLVAGSVAACARPGNGAKQPADTLGVAPVQPVGATAAPRAAAPHPLVGAWRVAQAGPRRGPGPGIIVSLAIDSVRAGDVYGRLSHLFAGDMGLDPTRFGPLTGGLRADTLALETPADEGGGRVAFRGLLAGDTVRLTSFWFGGGELVTPDAAWFLVRE